MSTTKKVMIAIAVVIGLWIINDPTGSGNAVSAAVTQVKSGLSAIPIFLSNVLN